MVCKFKIHGETVETFTGKKGAQSTRRLMLLDDSEGNRLGQICELNLPAESPAIGVGKSVVVEIEEISGMFAGRPRLRGKIVQPAGK